MLEQAAVPRVVVSGLSSGSGKTAISLGLVTALRNRGRTVQTFKVGPDLVDCAYLAHASRRACRNLDAWMLGEDQVLRSLAQGSAAADATVVEGAMGLFDGHGGEPAGGARARSFPGSTAELARLTASPLVLAIDAWAMGETAAAAALGIKTLDPGGNLVGVILNNVRSEVKRRSIEDTIWSVARLPVLGAVPHLEAVHIPELRTGLLPLTQNPHVDEALAQLGAAMERHCDLDLLERLMQRAPALPEPRSRRPAQVAGPPVRIGVAFDDAFCFYYAENLELLEAAGAEIVNFSPLEDAALPRDLGAIYLGGGVSEAYVPRLAANHGFIDSFRRAHAQGVPIYAESGGLLYVAQRLRTSDGFEHRMAGLLPVDIVLEAGTLRGGYRDLRVAADGLLGPVGTRLRGHEFHFGRALTPAESVPPLYHVHDGDGEPLGCEGWSTDRLAASFITLHFGQDPAIAARLVETARRAAGARRHEAPAPSFATPV
jgi:cobyrinic acid a,c-diamide synthase